MPEFVGFQNMMILDPMVWSCRLVFLVWTIFFYLNPAKHTVLCHYSKVILLLLILLPPVWSVGLKIDLRVGSVQGGIEKVQGPADGDRGKNYASFSGIPYAEPPVGKLRFKVC